MNSDKQQIFDALFALWGKQHWWPAQTRLEMMLGAILTQNTAWSNVEKAVSNLRRNGALNFQTLEKASQNQIAEWIRPAGYFNQKAGCIKGMVEILREHFDGSLHQLFALDTPALRTELLSWKGIGPETADSILLYAGKRPVFVVDAYTKRFLSRHGWCDKNASYDSVAKLFTESLPEDVQLFNEYHALIVQLGKEHCNTKPKCAGCPLEHLLPADSRG
ncbi:endonuclease III domain-containing protein [Pontiella sulfatireligans]|uniref:Ultraviolet N-glycosylase/AP lyase n=1 Tax=Pontiella sulfatireligans TaxID=2750658 RepID=A0A6C2UNW6_9BACT|nr:endonuclease III domain-containing protein [Pontiella sulfatireligans]VGO21014.1 Ultraviolet N-glycosylase/AP lyase [Pontiella sulfatireligans]